MEWLSDAVAAAAAIATDPYAALFICLGISFTLLSSVLNIRTLMRGRSGDFAPAMTYFASFFVLLFLFPLAVLLLEGGRAGLNPWNLGLQLGDWKKGLILSAAMLPISLFSVFVGSQDPAIRKQYPFSKDALAARGRFIVFESAYLLFYYLSWEFAFRGVILFCLIALLPHTLPGIAVAIMVQTFLSTLFHIGHPHSEVFGAFLLGILAGIVTAATGSIVYALFHHALVGILNDWLVYRRLARVRRVGHGAA